MVKPPHTSTYLEVVGRVKAFVDNPELEESLESRLRELNKTRNNLEHYAIDVDIDKIEKLISKIKIPLIKFLEKKLNNFKGCIPIFRILKKSIIFGINHQHI